MFGRAYAALLNSAPAAFRERYAAEMCALAAARMHDEPLWRRPWRALRELADLGRTVRRERRRASDSGPGEPWTRGFCGDAKTAWISLVRNPWSTAAIIGMLTIGLGSGVLGFSMMSTVLLRPLPFGGADGLMFIWGIPPQRIAGSPIVPLHGARVAQYRKSLTSFSAIEGFKADVFNLDAPGVSRERIDGLLTTSGLFDTMQVRPAAGRFFTAGEDVDGAPCVAVIGFGVWTRLFGADPTVISRAVRLNDRACTIVGVAPRGFDFPRGGEMPASFQYPSRTELWVAAPMPKRGPSDLTVLARLAPRVTYSSARAELSADTSRRDREVKASTGWNAVDLVPIKRQTVPPGIALTVTALFAAVTLLLLVAAGNAAQLFVVRSLQRRSELAVRGALGASARRLMRTAALEALGVTAVSAGLGTALAAAGITAVRTFGPERFPRLSETTLDVRVVAFVLFGAAVAAVLTAVGPVIVARRIDIEAALRDRMRGSSTGFRGMRAGLVAAQVMLAVVLLVSSGVLVRSFLARLDVNPGFRADHALTFEVTLPAERFPEELRGPMPASRPLTLDALDRFLTRLRAIPGVRAAAIGKPIPMSGAQEATVFAIEGRPRPQTFADVPITEYIVASEDMFAALGTPIVAGREFSIADRESSERVVIVNETMARQLWPGDSALGHRLKLGGDPNSPAPWMTVVGVAKDMLRYGLDDDAGPVMYVNYTQGPYPSLMTTPFVLRTDSADPLSVVPAVRAAANDVGLDVPVANPQTMTALVSRVSADAQFAMLLMVTFAAVALALTVAGLYGVVAFAVSQRRQELGIRSALGALPAQLVRLVMRDGLVPALIGGVLGLVAAFFSTRYLSSLLFGVSPLDPAVLGLVTAGLLAVVVLACLIPARRAARTAARMSFQG